MAYITNQDIIDRVGNDAAAQLTTPSGTVPDNAKIDEARQSAEGEVNGYIGRKYAVPVDLIVHPDLVATLKGYTLDVAVYRLHGFRQPIPAAIEKIRDNAIKWLQGISKGEIVLPAAETPASTTSDEPSAEWGSSPQNAAELREL